MTHEALTASRRVQIRYLRERMEPGTLSKAPTPIWTMQYYDRPYLDIAGVQTGHNGGNRQRCAPHAIEWILHAYRHEPHKPVIHLEAMYDGLGENGWPAVRREALGV